MWVSPQLLNEYGEVAQAAPLECVVGRPLVRRKEIAFHLLVKVGQEPSRSTHYCLGHIVAVDAEVPEAGQGG